MAQLRAARNRRRMWEFTKEDDYGRLQDKALLCFIWDPLVLLASAQGYRGSETWSSSTEMKSFGNCEAFSFRHVIILVFHLWPT